MNLDWSYLHSIAKKFSELEFFNSHLMSVGVDDKSGLIVYLRRQIRTDNLPKEFEGIRVEYVFQ